MSHEIRTPMNAIMGMADLLLDMGLASTPCEYVSVIAKNADHLLTLINEILDYSKIESGQLVLEEIDFDLRAVVDDVSDVVSVQAHKKGLEFIVLIPPAVPTRLVGDPERLKQIIINLANNAIKFTEQGQVSLQVSPEPADAGQIGLRVCVADTGIGISEEAQEMLFQPFSQADASITRRFGGTGLGLCISRRLAELMHGRIGVNSQPGEGATFWFTVRLARQSGPEPPRPLLPAEVRSTRILAVDAHELNRRAVGAMLAFWGCRFELAREGQQALDKLQDAARQGDPYGLVILDQALPGIPGPEVGERIRADRELGRPAMVILTPIPDAGPSLTADVRGCVWRDSRPDRPGE